MEFFCVIVGDTVKRRDCTICAEIPECKKNNYLSKIDKQLYSATEVDVLSEDFQFSTSDVVDFRDDTNFEDEYATSGLRTQKRNLKVEQIASKREKELERLGVPIPEDQLQKIVRYERL